MHYPAEDIPRPAREIFKKIWVRPMPDVSGDLAELVPLTNPVTNKPLNMTYCALRGASVMYTEYLRNMKVTAGFTMPIRRDGDLWGLIACHHYSGPKHVPYQVRAACEFLAQVVSLQHRAAEDREQWSYRMKLEGVHHLLLAQAAQEGGLAAMTDGNPTLLDGMDAGGAALYHRDRWWKVGDTPAENELNALGQWLAERPEFIHPTHPLYATDRLSQEFPPAAEFAGVASGILAVPLSRNFRNLMIWFRPETIRTVNWGGNPDDKPLVPGPHGPRLTPRTSFDLFQESVRNRSLPWKSVELEAAAKLRLLVMELVISRAEQLTELNAELLDSNEELDAFAYVASHDLKEPLRGIHKYAHQLLEDAVIVDEENRRKLEGLLRLTVRMDSLLDSLLHYSRVGRLTIEKELFELEEVVSEAIEMVGGRTTEHQVQFLLSKLPRVRADRVRVREIFTNLFSNSMKYNDHSDKLVEVGHLPSPVTERRTDWPETSRSEPVFFVKDNGIGIDPRHHKEVFKMFRRLHGRAEYGGGTGAGLTIVRRLVERHGGKVWLESEVGLGTTVYFTLGKGE